MGIYDREYVRRDEPRGLGARDLSAVALLIGANVLVYLAMLVTRQGQRYPLEELLSLDVNTLARPWEWWRFITYGFVHDPRRLAHIALNMLGLFFFGRPIEERYGKRELLLLYFLLLAASAVAFVLIERLRGTPEVRMYGASGAVAGILILFALNFPHRQVLLFFVLPTPAWVVAVAMVVLDMLGAMGGERGVAYTAHLTGAALAFVYYRGNWNLSGLLSRIRRWRRPRLRTVRPEMFTAEEADEELERTVDQILAKMSQHGMDSLTAAERRTLEEASRRYRERRR